MTSLFFDTSAALPLFLIEPHTAAAQRACAGAQQIFAWEWMRVEAEAGLARRKAPPSSWSDWRSWSAHVHWLKLAEKTIDDVCSFNRGLGLRAADAGHLFVFDQVCRALPALVLVSFDAEMLAAARRLGMAAWNA